MVGQCLVLVVRGEPALLQQPSPPPPPSPPPSPPSSPPPVAAAAATERPLWLQLQRSQRGPKGLGEERRVGRGPSCSIARPQPRENRPWRGGSSAEREWKRGEERERLAVGSNAIAWTRKSLASYVTNSTSAISVTWPDKISLSRPGEAEASISLIFSF